MAEEEERSVAVREMRSECEGCEQNSGGMIGLMRDEISGVAGVVREKWHHMYLET